MYLKGRFYWLRRYHGGLQAALEHFQQAIEEDAGYALAHAGVADALRDDRLLFAAAAAHRVRDARWRLPNARSRSTPTCRRRTRPSRWSTWATGTGRRPTRQFTRALELDPSQAMARIYWSWLMVLQGDIAGALDQARTAQEIGTAVAARQWGRRPHVLPGAAL